MDPDHPWRKAMDLWSEHACLFYTTDFQLDSHISQRADYPERLCGVWRRLRGYGNEKQAVMSFAIYEHKHWVSPEAVKCILSRLAARPSTIKDADNRLKVALERLKKVWFTYNKERADRVDHLRSFVPDRMWPGASVLTLHFRLRLCWTRHCHFTPSRTSCGFLVRRIGAGRLRWWTSRSRRV
ncbi:hypothetical protein PHMEG_00039860 [Phytophthora megakarya]|uniref:Uncharacterized protein n=1 Tax=Phytophthora megakarya TaxID=4795 RepID=A0A225UE67_9STRA|nr:hypothetical protein PHMEG_00039860 [Phytophthora megakarya]